MEPDQYEEDLQDLLDDISLPNQSMSMSNLSHISQSPFRPGGSTTPTKVPKLDLNLPLHKLTQAQPTDGSSLLVQYIKEQENKT